MTKHTPIDDMSVDEINKSMGERSMRQVASELGITVAALRKILAGKIDVSSARVPDSAGLKKRARERQ